MKSTHGQGLVIEMLAILKMLILHMHTADELFFKQNQDLEGRTLDFKILCDTINISNKQVELE